MCGISGLFSATVLDESVEADIARMRHALEHRGPDGHGTSRFEHAVLVHNRLAIIDLVSGDQPMSTDDGSVCLVFNGEIYNYRELRSRLSDYEFRTQSDTEVILALYRKYGIDGLGALRGMYAIALWDQREKTGWLARDPVGIKPLFYRAEAGRLVFASEAKGVLAAWAGARPSLDTEALHHLLNFRYVPGDGTLFAGIRQLAPGTAIRWRDGVLEHRSIVVTPETLPRDLAEAMEQAVKRHLVADVPVGCYLSGGIDSAVVAKVAAVYGPLSTYTLDVGDDPREAQNAAQTANWLGLPNVCMPFAVDDMVALHRSLVWHMEVPTVNALQSAILAERTAAHVKVALSGLGGDEIFLGYNAHKILWWAGQAEKFSPSAIRNMGAAVLERMAPRDTAWSEPARAAAMMRSLGSWSRTYGILRNVWDQPAMRRMVYGERMLDANPGDSFEWLQQHFGQDDDPVAAMQKFEFENKMVNDLLWHEDRVSMRVGLEVRVPFLDWELVRFAGNFDRRAHLPQGRQKHLLKSYARNILPPALSKRRKSGFQIHIADAFERELKPVIDLYLSEERIRHHGLFNADFIRGVRQTTTSAQRRWHYFLLYLMAQTHIFMEEFQLG